MTDLNRPLPMSRPCILYAAGHQIHWIQARRAYDDPSTHVPAEILDIVGDQLIVVGGDEVYVFRNHATASVRRVVSTVGPLAVIMSVGVLRFPSGHMVSVQRNGEDPLSQCTTG